jgi:Kef-type K+ transport system membrane component KefB
VLAVVILADLALIFMFTFGMQFARWASALTPDDDVGLLARLMWEIVGSLAYGALLGSLFALYLRFVGKEVTVVLLALCALITGTAAWLHFEPLLVALAAGLVVENVAPPEGDELRDAVERSALPVLVVFFVAAGANLNLDALAEIGLVALGVSLVRLLAIRWGTRLAGRAARLPAETSSAAWTGLVAQAGVTFGLATIVATEFGEWGARVQTLVLATSGLHVLVGPMLFRVALSQAGEIGQLDRAESTEPAERLDAGIPASGTP